jgi:phosphate transport system permease protein
LGRYTKKMNDNMQLNTPQIVPALDAPESIKRRNWRMLKDRLATYSMTLGGISVIIAIVLIFFYLLHVVYPLLMPASASSTAHYALPAPDAGNTLFLDVDEKAELAVRFTHLGHAVFFNVKTGAVITDEPLKLPSDAQITSYNANEDNGLMLYGLSNGHVVLIQRHFRESFEEQRRVLKPEITYPLGDKPVVLDEKNQPLIALSLQRDGQSTTLTGITQDQRLIVANYQEKESFLEDGKTLERTASEIHLSEGTDVQFMVLDKTQENLYLANKQGQILQYNVKDKEKPLLVQTVAAFEKGQITTLKILMGGISLLVGNSEGKVSQWFPVRNEKNEKPLTHIRDFTSQKSPITHISTEQRRKGFVAADSEGNIGIYNSTAHRTLLVEKISDVSLKQLVISPRADNLLVEDEKGKVHLWEIHNDHPEVSWTALWGKVWYESYPEPDYVWQSSSASNDFEPKFSLAPLTFGTLKGAFYALLVAVPLAVFGGIYSAYFMSPKMRGIVKPAVEVMEALPTVILGFLAGLWLAPVLEKNLPGTFALFLIVPIGVLVFAWLWHIAPKRFTNWLPDGWQAAMLIPVLLVLIWVSYALSTPLENVLFNGDIKLWLDSAGITFDQRNAMVVGFAMGVAVIPPIFSITEDAVFSVPKHLTTGSLALGATPWQTMTSVVILTASPGIFSAVMIGMGRAVGETMIVLMATGNTPVMDLNIFQGMRTLSANIAVEMPESEHNSTHYRVLFLAALVLFMFTFVVNTVAEIVRHRLRKRYGSL